jgi:hypothetical protein
MRWEMSKATGYMVEMQVSNYWLVAWQSPKGTALVFRDEDEAVRKVADHIRDWRDAVTEGFVEEAPKPSQFRVVEVEVTHKLKRRRRKR